MTPDELAKLHPRLYHVTSPDALSSIEERGLLPTSNLLTLFEVSPGERELIERRRRPETITLRHPLHGTVHVTDNLPLSEKKLEPVLDDGLTPADWLLMLNQRVFFWPNEADLGRLVSARSNRGRTRRILVFDTLSLARSYAATMELTAINTGSTIHKPARRGLATFVPLTAQTWHDFRRLRGRLDRLKEVVVRGPISDVGQHLLESYVVGD